MPDLDPRTLAARGGHEPDPRTGAISPPIELSTTFVRDAAYEVRGGTRYAREDSPGWHPAERLLTRLEGGQACALFASGTAAGDAALRALPGGARVLAPRLMYHGLRARIEQHGARLELAWYDPTDDVDALAPHLDAGTLLWLETPANPTWEIVDLRAACALARARGARTLVDNTVATPVLTRPLELGADLVLHAATKALGGHSDVVAGALVTADAQAPHWRAITAERAAGGAILGPFEAWLLHRGMRTLVLRVRAACEGALHLARWLDRDPRATDVRYPGLATHPRHDIARAQMNGGFGALVSFRVATGGAGDGYQAAHRVACATRLFAPATSLGGVESLIEHRAAVEPPGSPVPPDLLRLSIGIESPDDLVADLDRALAQTQPTA